MVETVWGPMPPLCGRATSQTRRSDMGSFCIVIIIAPISTPLVGWRIHRAVSVPRTAAGLISESVSLRSWTDAHENLPAADTGMTSPTSVQGSLLPGNLPKKSSTPGIGFLSSTMMPLAAGRRWATCGIGTHDAKFAARTRNIGTRDRAVVMTVKGSRMVFVCDRRLLGGCGTSAETVFDPKRTYKSLTCRFDRHAVRSREFLERGKVYLPHVEFIESSTLVCIERDTY